MTLPLVSPPEGDANTFLLAPLVSDLDTLDADIAILGAPYGVPYGMRGVANATSDSPRTVREQSARFGHFLRHYDFDFDGEVLAGKNIRIVDCGDVTADPLDIPGNSRRETEAVRRILARGSAPIVLGGDDSIPIPFFRAFEGHGPLVLVQIDAHLDFRDEIDGVREGYSSPIRRASEMPWIAGIVQIGMRGVGSARPSDVVEAREKGNVIIPAHEVHEIGVNGALARIPDNARYLITVDADGLDPSVAPGVGAPVPGGLSFDQAAGVLRGLASKGRIAGMDIVEITPANDINHITSLVAVRLIMNLIGAMVRSGQIG